MDLTDEDVERIIRIVDLLDYGEIHLEYGDLKLSLSRGPATSHDRGDRAPAGSPNDTPAKTPDVLPTSPGPKSEAPASAEPDAAGLHPVCSPVSGVFFSSPAPDASPFVAPGGTVEPDDVVCLVEVMKLFNSIPAGVAGRVVEILAQNGQLVQRGDVLLRIAPSS